MSHLQVKREHDESSIYHKKIQKAITKSATALTLNEIVYFSISKYSYVMALN